MKKVDLHSILADAREACAAQQAARPLADVKAAAEEAKARFPARSIRTTLLEQPGIIAEIKHRSPSMGDMRAENVAAARGAYAASSMVRAVSVLTDERHFGGRLEHLAAVREATGKPVLRKDFIFEEYQVFQARAAGADALLLMTNVFEDRLRLRGLYELTKGLGMDALVETHTLAEIEAVVDFADWVGINSRDFKVSGGFDPSKQSGPRDVTTDLGTFDLVRAVPDNIVKLAESGIHTADDLAAVFAAGFHGGLIGTALLMAPEGPAAKLETFSAALPIT